MRRDTNTTGASDQELVQMSLAGNNMAFHTLMDRHKGYITRLTSRFLFHEKDVQDTVQDTFIRVWKNLAAYDSHNRFTTWLYTINFNLCLDRLKALKRRPEVQLNEEMIRRFSGSFADDQETREPDLPVIAEAVRRYSAGLSKVQRLVFVLRDINDLSVDEVCHITGFKPDKVKANLFYARKFMRGKLLKGGYL